MVFVYSQSNALKISINYHTPTRSVPRNQRDPAPIMFNSTRRRIHTTRCSVQVATQNYITSYSLALLKS